MNRRPLSHQSNTSQLIIVSFFVRRLLRCEHLKKINKNTPFMRRQEMLDNRRWTLFSNIFWTCVCDTDVFLH